MFGNRRLPHVLTIGFLLVCGTIAFGQADSLRRIWNDTSFPDSTRVGAMVDLINDHYLYRHPDSALVLAEELLRFGVSGNNREAVYAGYFAKGQAATLQGDYVGGRSHFERSLLLAEELKDQERMASSLRLIGITAYYVGNYPVAVTYLDKSFQLSEALGAEAEVANNLTVIGVIYHTQGDYQKALEYHLKGLKLSSVQNNPEMRAGAMMNVGIAYQELGEFGKALEYHQSSMKIFEELGQGRRVAGILHNIGETYASMGDSQTALEYYNRSLDMKVKANDSSATITTRVSMGQLYLKMGREDLALKGCLTAEKLSSESGNLESLYSSCECIYEAYRAMGNGKMALVYLEKKEAYRDSLDAAETAKKLERMEFSRLMKQDSLVRVEETRQMQLVHEKEIETKNHTRNLWISGALLALMVSGVLFIRYRRMRRKKVMVEIERDRSDDLLRNVLPPEIALELKKNGRTEPRTVENVSVLFTDFKGFTQASSTVSAVNVMEELNVCFEAFDRIIEKHHIEKIKTIGDAYMAVGGLLIQSAESARHTVLAALEMQEFIRKRRKENETSGKFSFEMRVGIHTGPVVAGIVGLKKLQYDIWGDTVNTASRMESSGEVGRVNISDATHALVRDYFDVEDRGEVEVKGKGSMRMYFVHDKILE